MVKGLLMTSWVKNVMLHWSLGEILADFYENRFFGIFLGVQCDESLMCKRSDFDLFYTINMI